MTDKPKAYSRWFSPAQPEQLPLIRGRTMATILLLFLLAVIAWSVLSRFHVPGLHHDKLMDIQSDTAQATVTWPASSRQTYNFILAFDLNVPTSDDDLLTVELAGELRIRQGEETLITHSFTAADLGRGNWLHGRGCRGFLLYRLEEAEARRLTPGQPYQVELRFTARPPSLHSLWMRYLGR